MKWILSIALIHFAAAYCLADDAASAAAALRSKGDVKGARALLAEALSKAPRAIERAPLAQALAETDLDLSRFEEAIKEGAACATLFASLADHAHEVDCLTVIGQGHAARGDFPAATEAFQKAITTARQYNLPWNEATLLNNLGSVRFLAGDYSAVHGLYLDAEQLVQRHSGESWAPRLDQLTRANLAGLYQRLGQYPRALDIYRTLEEALRNEPATRARMLSNICLLYTSPSPRDS